MIIQDSFPTAKHVFTGAFFADVHEELLVGGDVKMIQIVMGCVDGKDLFVTEVIERFYQSSAALTRTDPCKTCRALDVVNDTDFFFDLRLILFQIKSRQQP